MTPKKLLNEPLLHFPLADAFLFVFIERIAGF